MIDFIIEFRDWFVNFLSNIAENIWECFCVVGKIFYVSVLAIITLPLWILPFIYWLVFEKEREEDAAD